MTRCLEDGGSTAYETPMLQEYDSAFEHKYIIMYMLLLGSCYGYA